MIADKRILVVDDNPINRMVASELLKMMGCQVMTANDGRAALLLVEDMPCDAVLMDLQMPEMDGFEATKRLRQAGFSSPVVAVSAATCDADKRKALGVGMNAFLSKPLNNDELLRCLHAVLAV